MTSITEDGRSAEHSGSDLSAVARGGLANLVGAVVSALTGFGLVLAVARAVPAAEAGRFFTITSLFLLLEAVGKLGADTGLVYFIARWRTLGENERIGSGLRAAFVPVVVTCAVLGLVMGTCAPWIADLIGVDRHGSVQLLRLLAVVLPLAAAYDVALGATRGFGRMRPTVLVEKVVRPTVQVLLVLVVLAVGWKGTLGYAWSLPYVGAFVLGVLSLRAALRRRAATAGRSHWNPQVAKQFWSFSLPRAVAGVAQLALQRFDIVLVAALRGPKEAAIYTAASRFLVVGQFVVQAITAPLQPHLSAALSIGAADRAMQLYRASTTWLVLACWPLFGLTATLAPLYVRVFGKDYSGGAVVVVVLSIAMFVATGVGLVDSVIIMAGRSSWNLATTLLALVVNIGVDLLLVPSHGLVGAAIGWLCSIVAGNVVPLIVSWRWLHLHPFGRSTYTAYGLCAVSYLLIPGVAAAVSHGSRIAVVFGIAVGTVVYVAGLRRWWRLFDLTGLARRRVSPA